MTSSATTHDWRAIVESVDDKNRHVNNLYPIVYVFSNNTYRRDSGPESGVYDKEPW